MLCLCVCCSSSLNHPCLLKVHFDSFCVADIQFTLFILSGTCIIYGFRNQITSATSSHLRIKSLYLVVMCSIINYVLSLMKI